MKRRRLALLMALVMTFTSVDGSAVLVGAAEETVTEGQAEAQDTYETPEEAAVPEETVDQEPEAVPEPDVNQEEEVYEAPETLQEGEPDTWEENAVTEASQEEWEETSNLPEEESENTEASEEEEDLEEAIIDNSSEEETLEEAELLPVAEENENQDASFIPSDDQITALTPDVEYEVSIADVQGKAWFSFTPQEDERYSLVSASKDGTDPLAYLYDSREVTSEGEYKAMDDDGKGSSNDFALTYSMTAGTTYYFCVQILNENGGEPFTVALKKVQSVESIAVNPVKTEYIAGMDGINLDGMEVTVNYTSGEVKTYTMQGQEITDAYGEKISCRITDENDIGYWAGEVAAEGSYTVTVSCGEASDSYSVQAKDIEQCEVYQGELHSGKNEGLKLGTDGSACYKYIPEETGSYRIPCQKLLKKSESGYEWPAWSDGGYPLEEGGVYYVFFGGTPGDIFEADMKRVREIAQVTIERQGKTLVIADRDQYVADGTILRISYKEEGIPDETVAFEWGSAEDSYGNGFAISFQGEDETEYGYWETLPVGNYTVKITCPDGGVLTYSIRSASYDEAVQNEISEGSNTVRAGDSSRNESEFYRFTPAESGTYVLESDFQDWISVEGYTAEGEEYTEIMGIWGTSGEIHLDGGKTYFFGFSIYGGSEELNLTVKRIPEILSLRPEKEQQKTEFLQNTEEAYPDFDSVTLTYDNGKTEKVTLYNYDSYGNYVGWARYAVKDGAVITDEEADEYPAAGDYVFRIYCGEKYTDVPFKVVTLAEKAQGEIPLNTSTVLDNQTGEMIYRFTSAEAGRYEIESDVPFLGVEVYTVSGSLWDRSGSSYKIYVDLEANTQYCLKAEIRTIYPSPSVIIQKSRSIAEMTVKEGKTEYLAGLDTLDVSEISTTVTYSDGTVSTVRGYDRVEGYELNYRAVNRDSGEIFTEGETLKVGTYELQPYLSGYDSQVMAEISVTPAVIQAVKWNAADAEALTRDTWQEVPSGYTRLLYSFTAEEAGTYTAEKDSSGACYVYFYRDGETGLEETGGGKITLAAGETCAVAVDTYLATRFRITAWSDSGEEPDPDDPDPDDPEETEDPVLRLNERKRVSIQENGQVREYTFTPERDGLYLLTSFGEEDTFAVLCENGERIAEDDDGGEELNFALKQRLKAGVEYTYRVQFLDDTVTGSFSMELTEGVEKKIEKAEIIQKDEEYHEKIDPQSVFSFRITYEDGSAEEFSFYNRSDNWNNRFETGRYMISDNQEVIWLRYGTEEEYRSASEDGEWGRQIELSVYRRAVSEFETLTAGEETEIELKQGETRYYKFIPDVDGQYVLKAAGKEGIYPSTGFYEYEDDGSVDEEWFGEDEVSVILKAGQLYWLSVRGYSEEEGVTSGTVVLGIRKVKELVKLEVVKAPDKTTALEGADSVNLAGMELKAVYTDGTEETIRYGETDSQGRTIGYIPQWINDNLCRVYVTLGELRTYVDMTAESRDAVPEIQEGVCNILEADAGNENVYKLVPTAAGSYFFSVTGGRVMSLQQEDSVYVSSVQGYYYLEAGKTYYVSIYAEADTVEITAATGNCAWEVVERTESTCETEGKLVERCTVHEGETRETVLPRKPHNYQWIIDKAADCGTAGSKHEECSVCQDKKAPVTIPATGAHRYQWIIDKAAGCKAAGSKHEECSVCQDKKAPVTIPATGAHRYQWIIDKAAGCGTAGSKHEECSVCHGKKAAVSIPATNQHQYGAWVTVKEATVLAEGTKQRTCTVCGTGKENASIPRLPAALKLTANSLVIKAGQSTTKFKVTEMAKGDALKSVVSSDTRLLKVSSVKANGTFKLTALKKAGTVNLTVTLASGKAQTIKVKIQKAAVKTSAITGLPKSVILQQKKTLKLSPVISPVTSLEKITYKSSNKKVATVSSKGVVKGVKAGTAKITVKAGKKKFTVTVKVQGVKTTALKKVPSAITLKVKKSTTLKPVRVPAASTDKITYVSSNKSVAAVNSKGKITAKKKGTAVITVKCGSAVAKCTVIVK